MPGPLPVAGPLAAVLVDLIPMLERVRRLDADGVVRLRIGADLVVALAPLPVGVIAARTLRIPDGAEPPVDVTVGVAALADVLTAALADVLAVAPADGLAATPRGAVGPLRWPPRRDVDWHHTPPPRTGWSRVAELADEPVRAAVRAAASAVTAAPLAAAVDLALDLKAFPNAAVPAVAALDRRGVSALVRLGFCPRGGKVAVDVAGRWTRLVAAYGSIYLDGVNRGSAAGPSLLSLLS